MVETREKSKSEKEKVMTVIGWRKGKERVLRTNNPAELHIFAEAMDRVEYLPCNV